MLQIGIDDYSLNDDEEILGWAIIEFFEDMDQHSARVLLDMTLMKHTLSVEELIVCAACKAYEKAVTSFVTGKDEQGMESAHQMQSIVDNAAGYAESSGIVELLWDCLNQVMDEE